MSIGIIEAVGCTATKALSRLSPIGRPRLRVEKTPSDAHGARFRGIGRSISLAKSVASILGFVACLRHLLVRFSCYVRRHRLVQKLRSSGALAPPLFEG